MYITLFQLTCPAELFLELLLLLADGICWSVVAAVGVAGVVAGVDAAPVSGNGTEEAFLFSAGTVGGGGSDVGAGAGGAARAAAAAAGDADPWAGEVSILVASCSRNDSNEPLVATETFCRKALCFAASSGSRRREEERLGVEAEVGVVLDSCFGGL
jgi:hypothetical protein